MSPRLRTSSIEVGRGGPPGVPARGGTRGGDSVTSPGMGREGRGGSLELLSSFVRETYQHNN